MTALTPAVTGRDQVVDATAIAPPTHAEIGALARVELARFLALVESLGPDDWARPTMCSAWSVRELLAHQAGAYASGASLAEFRRQWLQRPKPGRPLIDTVNATQVRDRAGRAPAELIAELRDVGPRAIAARQGLPWLLRNLPLPVPDAGLRTVGYITDDLYLRDTWSHYLDICCATGRPPQHTPEHDGRFTALVVRDLAAGLARALRGGAVLLALDGPAGGRFRIGRGAPGATIATGAVDFHLRASGRIGAAEARARSRVEGDEALATQALERSAVVY